MHQLYFKNSLTVYQSPLEFIYIDIISARRNHRGAERNYLHFIEVWADVRFGPISDFGRVDHTRDRVLDFQKPFANLKRFRPRKCHPPPPDLYSDHAPPAARRFESRQKPKRFVLRFASRPINLSRNPLSGNNEHVHFAEASLSFYFVSS